MDVDEVSAAECGRAAKKLKGEMRTFAVSYSSAGAGVLFFTLAGGCDVVLGKVDEMLLVSSLMMFFLTVVLYLWAMEVERQRLSFLSNNLHEKGGCRNCSYETMLQKKRGKLEKSMYVTVFLATIGLMVFVTLRVS